MIYKTLIKIKKKRIWYFFLLYFVNPIYNFFWTNILNLHGRILYFFWFLKKRNYVDLSKSEVLKVSDYILFQNFANEVYKSCTDEVLSVANKNIFETKEKNYNETNSNENKYFEQIYDLIDEQTQKKIIDFAQSELLISTAAKYLGVFPILAIIALTYHVPRKSDLKRGSMLFHKDEKGYKSLDLFLNINDIDELSGPLKVLETESDKLGPFALVDDNRTQTTIKGNRGKLSDEIIADKFNSKDTKITSSSGKRGTGLFVDSFRHYHGGGHCIEKNRILLRILYATNDCTVLPENKNNTFLYFQNIKKNEIKSIFLKFFYFKRSFLFINKYINKLFLNFYRILHYKI